MIPPAVLNQMSPISRRAERKEEIRRRIVDAAREIFDRQGLGPTSVEQILLQANVSRATFYAQFGGKQEVARVIVAEMWERANALYGDFALMPDVSATSIRDWLGRVFDTWHRERDGMSMVLADLFPLIAADSLARHEEMVARLIGDERHWQAFNPDDRRRRAYVLIYQLERTMQAYHIEGWRDEPDALLDMLALSWTALLKG